MKRLSGLLLVFSSGKMPTKTRGIAHIFVSDPM